MSQSSSLRAKKKTDHAGLNKKMSIGPWKIDWFRVDWGTNQKFAKKGSPVICWPFRRAQDRAHESCHETKLASVVDPSFEIGRLLAQKG